MAFLDDPRVSSVVFYPRKIEIPESLPEYIKILKFKMDDGIIIGAISYVRSPDLPTILMFHGNGEIASDYHHFYKEYHGIDVNLTVADFRGYGFSTGKPKYTGLINDAMPIYNQYREWMEQNGFINSLFVMGRSLGSVCASEVGSHNPEDLKGIIFESGFASTYNMMTRLFGLSGPDITETALEPFSNDIRIKKFKKPTLVIHGKMDWIVPVDEGKQIFSCLPEGIDKELILIDGAGHNDISFFESEYFPPLKSFINKNK